MTLEPGINQPWVITHCPFFWGGLTCVVRGGSRPRVCSSRKLCCALTSHSREGSAVQNCPSLSRAGGSALTCSCFSPNPIIPVFQPCIWEVLYTVFIGLVIKKMQSSLFGHLVILNSLPKFCIPVAPLWQPLKGHCSKGGTGSLTMERGGTKGLGCSLRFKVQHSAEKVTKQSEGLARSCESTELADFGRWALGEVAGWLVRKYRWDCQPRKMTLSTHPVCSRNLQSVPSQ